MQAKGRTGLARAFDGTEWTSSGWAQALRQAPPQVVIRTRKNFVRIDGLPSRCFLVDPIAFKEALETQ
jgi:hypothetical protein